MVDFKKLRSAKTKALIIDPIEIFRRLPKPPGITDLYTSQAQVLSAWHQRRNERDIVIKLHTGGGKTLVGLLIAQSLLNELREPVVYLSPTTQLVDQTLGKAAEYGIPAVAYTKNADFPDEFLTGKSVLICAYQALFNGCSKFGAPGSNRDVLKAGAIILDDAHVSFSTVRDCYTLKVQREATEKYETLTNMFRNDFQQIDKLGTFDDVVGGTDYNVLEIPYWSWASKSTQVREYLRRDSEDYPFVWPFLRDSFDYCHALISRNAFVITPVFPLVGLVPTFSSCARRIFMSATIADDSAIIRTFNARDESISKPISSSSLAGISERMILAPALMKIDIHAVPQILRKIAQWASETQKTGTVILVPSAYTAESWSTVATFADSPQMVSECVAMLQNRKSTGPFVFANRYDGIDLPGDSCRILIFDGLPRAAGEYDQYRNTAFTDATAINTALAQRIEQGMGRAARGPGDYCVVIVTGKDLVAWIGRSSNRRFLTSSTRAQLEIGVEISKNVKDRRGLLETILACLHREKEWIEYHAETLAESVGPEEVDMLALTQASLEQKAFRLWLDGYHEKAITKLDKYCEDTEELDQQNKGWLLQCAARMAHHWGDEPRSLALQQRAYASNRNLLRPQGVPPYVALAKPSRQAEAIVAAIDAFSPRRGFLANFDEIVSHLVPEASSNQFEAALDDLGRMLGFSSERPDNIYGGGIGPDVLWLLDDRLALVIEAKSRKDSKKALTKDQHGQLLVAVEWFKKKYPDYSHVAVSVHPNKTATKNAIAHTTRALTYEKLAELMSNARELFKVLSESIRDRSELTGICEKLLAEKRLRPHDIVKSYLLPFELEVR